MYHGHPPEGLTNKERVGDIMSVDGNPEMKKSLGVTPDGAEQFVTGFERRIAPTEGRSVETGALFFEYQVFHSSIRKLLSGLAKQDH